MFTKQKIQGKLPYSNTSHFVWLSPQCVFSYSNELQTIISDSLDNPSDDKYDLCKPQDILKVENLSKTYGRETVALHNVSFQIKRAEVNIVTISIIADG